MSLLGYNAAIMKLACLLAVALCADAQTLQVTSHLGTKSYSKPDSKGAVAAAQKALDPSKAESLYKLAQAQLGIWQNKEAVETLTRALALAPDNAEYLTERGHRYLPLREFAKAEADLDRSARIDPRKMATWYHLGLAHYFLNEFSSAADAFAHAVATAPNTDEKINSTNWLYAALRRAGKTQEAAEALKGVPASMTNESPHTKFYLNLVRFFQGAMTEAQAVPPMPPAGNTDDEVELPFDTTAYGVGNWHVYNGQPGKAQEYFKRVLKGHVWVTWGFIGSELEVR
jgi:tetratricopeptide (TPR) repeat protein